MKKFKLEKPFSSFMNTNGTLKDKWRKALHDPAYLLCCGVLVLLLIVMLSSCNRKYCPAYAKNNTEQSKHI